jgi:glycosyltransferase involved in cell wall biosynthesis
MQISVVIPLFNKVGYICRAIQSVLCQSHADFELIIVDDGSTDNSVERVREIPDHRIHLIRQENAGVSAARNRGVREARSNLVAFLDADDEWLPDFLETVLQLKARFPEAKVWGTAYAMQNGSGRLTLIQSVKTNQACLINFWAAAIVAQPIHPSSMLLEKIALEAAGGFHPNMIRLEDTEMLVRMALRHPIAYVPEVKAIYHLESDNRTDKYTYSGNFPFFVAARTYLNESGQSTKLPVEAEYYLALMTTRSLQSNWLAGNYAAMREIINDGYNIKGFRVICVWWWLVSLIPHPVVLAGWWMRSVAARCLGRRGKMNPVRSIYRPATSENGLQDRCV